MVGKRREAAGLILSKETHTTRLRPNEVARSDEPSPLSAFSKTPECPWTEGRQTASVEPIHHMFGTEDASHAPDHGKSAPPEAVSPENGLSKRRKVTIKSGVETQRVYQTPHPYYSPDRVSPRRTSPDMPKQQENWASPVGIGPILTIANEQAKSRPIRPSHPHSVSLHLPAGSGPVFPEGYPPFQQPIRPSQNTGTQDMHRKCFAASLQHPYPTEDEKQYLMRQTGLSMGNLIQESYPVGQERPAHRGTIFFSFTRTVEAFTGSISIDLEAPSPRAGYDRPPVLTRNRAIVSSPLFLEPPPPLPKVPDLKEIQFIPERLLAPIRNQPPSETAIPLPKISELCVSIV